MLARCPRALSACLLCVSCRLPVVSSSNAMRAFSHPPPSLCAKFSVPLLCSGNGDDWLDLLAYIEAQYRLAPVRYLPFLRSPILLLDPGLFRGAASRDPILAEDVMAVCADMLACAWCAMCLTGGGQGRGQAIRYAACLAPSLGCTQTFRSFCALVSCPARGSRIVLLPRLLALAELTMAHGEMSLVCGVAVMHRGPHGGAEGVPAAAREAAGRTQVPWVGIPSQCVCCRCAEDGCVRAHACMLRAAFFRLPFSALPLLHSRARSSCA